MYRFNPPPDWPEPPSDTWRPPAGWEPDPTGRNEYRYWDGQAWTEHVSNGPVQASDPI